ncbi:hypothetical protein GQ42DRAFT_162707 [Ramicandelaber brevisporus]|nr:hypothetical protein GQ42DRAFT_162707 [Ramicandelaber brevisporus]
MFVPADILLEIVAYLDHYDVISLSLVCCTWNTVLSSPVHQRLVYLVRHRYHHLSLDQYLAKHGHLIRELCVSDAYDVGLFDFTVANYHTLRLWLSHSCGRILRLRILPGGKPIHVVAMLGYLDAIPFLDQDHRQYVLDNCSDDVADMFARGPQVPISGWQFPFLGLDSLGDSFIDHLRWELTSAWLERVSLIGSDPPLVFMFKPWPKLTFIGTGASHRFRLGEWHAPEFKRICPHVRRVGPLALFGSNQFPHEIVGLYSNCNGALREYCVRSRAYKSHGYFSGVGYQIAKKQPQQTFAIVEEVALYAPITLNMLVHPAVYDMMDVRYVYLGAQDHYREEMMAQFFDVAAVEKPMMTVEYLTLSGINDNTGWPGANGWPDGVLSGHQTTISSFELFMTPERLGGIPERFPNLKFLCMDGLSVVNDKVVKDILYCNGDVKSKLRLRRLRRLVVEHCSVTDEGYSVIGRFNKLIRLA